MQKKKVFYFLVLAVIVHIGLFIFRNTVSFAKDVDSLQQENFIAYVDSLRSGEFPEELNYIDTRLFPGLPFTILAIDVIVNNSFVSALLVSFLSLLLIYFCRVYLTKDPFFSFWITVFPPIIYEQTSKVSTESLLIALSLFSLVLIKKQKYYLASLILGLATIVRLIAAFIFLGLSFNLYKTGQKNKLPKYLLIFLIFPLALVAFNLKFFNGEVFYQVVVNAAMGDAGPGIPQMSSVIWEEFSQRNFRVLVVGLTYIIFSLYIFVKTAAHKGDFIFKNDRRLILIAISGMMLFVYLVIPNDFLALARRFLSVIFPLVFVANYKNLADKKKLLALSFLTLPLAFV